MTAAEATRWVRRIGLPLVIVGAVVLYVRYDFLGVPAGMDTLPDTHPPGSSCLIDTWGSALAPGQAVFVDLPDGSTVLSRVESVQPDGSFEIRHDNRRSGFGYLERLGPYPPEALRGLVLVVFPASQEVPGRGG